MQDPIHAALFQCGSVAGRYGGVWGRMQQSANSNAFPFTLSFSDMPLPLGHMMVGWMTNEVLGGGAARPDWKTLLFIAVLSNLPDLDIAAGLLVHGNGFAFHRGPTHSIAFASMAAIAAANVWRLWPVPRMRWTSVFLIIVGHTICDLLFTASPVSLFWPLEIHWAAGAGGWGESLRPILLEAHKDAGIVLACLVTVVLLRLRATLKAQTRADLPDPGFSGLLRKGPRVHRPGS